MQADLLTKRMGVFAELARRSQRRFGRTALMKLCYFLQEVRDVPLNYNFSLYTYGPFDSEVLADLQTAEELKVLETEVELYPGGYGYLIGSGAASDRVRKQAANFLREYHDAIVWAADSLAPKRPPELELMSTIVFIWKQRNKASDKRLMSLVRAVKPHFSEAEVQNQIDWLRGNDLLQIEETV